MVDFRFHLVSVIAVLFALAIGVALGSGFLGGPLLDRIKRDVAELDRTNEDLRSEIVEISDQLDEGNEFALAVHDVLVEGSLTGERVVLVVFEGTEGAVVEEATESIERAAGEVVTLVTLTDRLSLQDDGAEEELDESLGGPGGNHEELRSRLAHELGTVASDAATTASATAHEEFDALVTRLIDAEFVRVDELSSAGGEVPFGASFVVLGGGASRPSYDVTELTTPLAVALARDGSAVVAADSSDPDQEWGIVEEIRNDADAVERVSTVDQIQTVPGRIGLVLALELMDREDDVRHIGVEDGAEAVVPLPTPTS